MNNFPPTTLDESISEPSPLVIPRAQHPISRRLIDEDALKILYRLHRHGYRAFLVGGCVRDLLLGRPPKDFDIGTNATPSQIKRLFSNCFLVGRRFRLAHIHCANGKVIEVATFRRQPRPEEIPAEPTQQFRFVENVFGTPAEDAFRRDFTINALFYDIATFAVFDYTGGIADLHSRTLKVIGQPEIRFREDPVRMLRAIELAKRLDFTMDDKLLRGLHACAAFIADAAPARIRDRLFELAQRGVLGTILREAAAFGMLAPLLAGYQGNEATFALLERLDERSAAGVPTEEPMFLAALFLERFLAESPPHNGVVNALKITNELLQPHCQYFRIAHGIRHQAQEILVTVGRLLRGPGARGARRLLLHPFFAPALELLSLWSLDHADLEALIRSWRNEPLSGGKNLQENTPQQSPKRSGRPRRRRRNRRKAPGACSTPALSPPSRSPES